jgi:hypothetical protein
MKIIKHIRRWNLWRKYCLNSPTYKLFVLLGLKKSATLALTLLPEEQDEFEKGMKGE